MGWVSRVVQRLRRGVELPFVDARIVVDYQRRTPAKGSVHRVHLSELRRLQELFPALRRFDAECVETDPDACLDVLEFCRGSLPLMHEPAREVLRRNLLARLAARVPALAERAAEDIARSNWESGVADRSASLLHADLTEAEKSELRRAIDDHEAHYQAREGLIAKRSLWQGMGGDLRGRSLAAYYRDNEEALRDKRILHFSPEPELEAFLRERGGRLGFRYTTSNPFGVREDLALDITRIDLPDESLDLVLCHRVLEHVLNDRRAIAELYRVLAPGGILSVSVPQSMHREDSEEWAMPDESCHGHVREYGRDFEARLAEPGFKVSAERSLLDRSEEEHRRDRTYPLRFYLCTRPEAS